MIAFWIGISTGFILGWVVCHRLAVSRGFFPPLAGAATKRLDAAPAVLLAHFLRAASEDDLSTVTPIDALPLVKTGPGGDYVKEWWGDEQ